MKASSWTLGRAQLMEEAHGHDEDGTPRNYWLKISPDGEELYALQLVGQYHFLALRDGGWGFPLTEAPEWTLHVDWLHVARMKVPFPSEFSEEEIEEAMEIIHS